VDEVDRNFIDGHLVMGKSVHCLLVLAPVVSVALVCHQIFQVGGVSAVLPLVIGEIIRPAHVGESFAQIGECGFRNGDGKRSFLHEGCLHKV
jgi:hypothetical protein